MFLVFLSRSGIVVNIFMLEKVVIVTLNLSSHLVSPYVYMINLLRIPNKDGALKTLCALY